MHCAIKRGAALSLAAALAFLPALNALGGLSGVVNINTATVGQLELPFSSVGELTRVSGIGDKALESMRKHCVLEGRTTAKLE